MVGSGWLGTSRRHLDVAKYALSALVMGKASQLPDSADSEGVLGLTCSRSLYVAIQSLPPTHSSMRLCYIDLDVIAERHRSSPE